MHRLPTRVLGVLLASCLALACRANVSNGSFSSALTQGTSWRAGTGVDRAWVTGGFESTGSTARLPNSSGKTRAMLQSLPIPPAARYRVTFRARATSIRRQEAFLLVLAVDDRVTLDLSDNAFRWGFAKANTRVIARVRVPNSASNNRWSNVALNFNVTTQDVRRYDRLVFVFAGSTTAAQTLEYDDVACDVPIPTSSGDDAPIHVDWYLAPSSVRSLGAINWNTPVLTTAERQINWPSTARPLHPQIRADRFGLRARGSFVIPQGGLWTFYVGSDEGNTLDINGTRVVNADRLQSFTLRSGAITLTQGTHAFELHYFERTGSNGLVLYWQGPADPASTAIPEDGYENTPQIRKTRVTRWQEVPAE